MKETVQRDVGVVNTLTKGTHFQTKLPTLSPTKPLIIQPPTKQPTQPPKKEPFVLRSKTSIIAL